MQYGHMYHHCRAFVVRPTRHAGARLATTVCASVTRDCHGAHLPCQEVDREVEQELEQEVARVVAREADPEVRERPGTEAVVGDPTAAVGA